MMHDQPNIKISEHVNIRP